MRLIAIAALGALAVGYGRTTLSEAFPDQWTYFLGLLFVVVILFLPAGLASALSRWGRAVADRLRSRPPSARHRAPSGVSEEVAA